MKNSINQPQQIAHGILRATLGITLFTFGASKLLVTGLGNFAEHMMERFSGLLPDFMLPPFVWTLPFFELGLGFLLILGLFSLTTLTASGVLIAILTFGAILSGDPGMVANNLIYAVIIFFLLWNLNANHWSVDTKIGRNYESKL